MKIDNELQSVSIEPSSELDAIIAEKVLGMEVSRNHKGGWSLGPPDYYDSYGSIELMNPLPFYSEDINAAWDIVDKLKAYEPSLSWNHERGVWTLMLLRGPDLKPYPTSLRPAHAICLTAIKFMESWDL